MSKEKKSWEKVKELREHHLPLLEQEGLSSALYFPKMFYKPPGKDELFVSFFVSELQRGQDIYTEMVDREFASEDPARTLYKWEYNQDWSTQYEATGSSPVRYLIPIRDLTRVKASHNTEEYDDCDISEMTMKDLYAIIQNKPVSDKQWLNSLIKSK